MKKCISCFVVKEIEDYYNHKEMKDGKLNVCKDCVKKRSKKRGKELSLCPKWMDKKRKMDRESYHRLKYKEKHKYKPSSERKKEIMDKYNLKYPEKYSAKKSAQRISVSKKGNHKHLWSYNEEHYKCVIELKPKKHYKLHRFIKYDQRYFMYRDLDGNLLDTREKHIEYMNKTLT